MLACRDRNCGDTRSQRAVPFPAGGWGEEQEGGGQREGENEAWEEGERRREQILRSLSWEDGQDGRRERRMKVGEDRGAQAGEQGGDECQRRELAEHKEPLP